MSTLNPGDRLQSAKDWVRYLIDNDCVDINREHHANTAAAAERAILDPLVEIYTNTPGKVQKLIEIQIAWGGSENDGVIYLDRFKQSTAAGNREALWNLFHISIHEYLHLLANDKWFEYAAKQDDARSNVLVEGFCDFLTLNVRASLKLTPHLRKQVEGPYYDGKAPIPQIDPGVYAQHAQAEHVVAVVGIHNALAAYFKGEVELIGGS